ncbi:hypothetical protein LJR234_006078 [Mesorhizobium amorphae]|uniref:hypothetical protein n=1 Tax=Mesorhizobium amorphae TaxID=71433 RepID=UPI003ED10F8E
MQEIEGDEIEIVLAPRLAQRCEVGNLRLSLVAIISPSTIAFWTFNSLAASTKSRYFADQSRPRRVKMRERPRRR